MISALASMKQFARVHERTFAYIWTVTLIYLLLDKHLPILLGVM